MFARLLLRAAFLRRGRTLSALLAVMVAAAVGSAMLNLFVDVQAKLGQEFRNYGANIVVVADEGRVLPADALKLADAALAGKGLAVPFAYLLARTASGQPVVVAGTDFSRLERIDRWWAVSRWPEQSGQALVGERAAALAPSGRSFDLFFSGRALALQAVGTVRTGAAEDSRIYVGLPDFQAWSGLSPTTLEIAALGSSEQLRALVAKLSAVFPGARVRPVRQILEGQAHVLGKIRATLLASAVLILLTSALCLLATLLGWVFDRRRDVALMKALGASERAIAGLFAAEAAALGLVGALAGCLLGVGIAAWIGRVDFQTAVQPRWEVLPLVMVAGVAIALLAAVAPISLLGRVEPATILRGE